MGRLVPSAARQHPPCGAGDRETLEAWRRRTLRILAELDVSEMVASGDGVAGGKAGPSTPQLLVRILMDLTHLVDTAARLGADRHLRGCVPPSIGSVPDDLAAEASTVVDDDIGQTVPGHADVASAPLHDGAVTILVAVLDCPAAAGGHAGNRRPRSVLAAHGAAVRNQIAGHGGVEVEAAGAPLAAVFASPRRALLCAIGLQRTLAGHAAEYPQEPLRVRIALHTGDVIPERADAFGNTSMVAARIASLAGGGEILVSDALRELVVSAGDLHFGPGRTIELEGPGGSCTVHEACWTGRHTGGETVGGVFHRDGQSWTIAWRGRRCVVRDLRGLHYIAQLLRHPGREFHALDLIGSTGAGLRRDGVAALDAPAKAAYHRRLDDLRDDLEEAERTADAGRAALARAGREVIMEELAAAVGLGGRDRRAAAAAERARSTVTHAIRAALKRVRGVLPMLADELRLRIKTGVYCVYVPDPAHPTDWVL